MNPETPPKTPKQPSWRLRYVNGAARSQNTRAEKEEAAFMQFIASVVRPAFSQIAGRLSATGRTVTSQETRASCSIAVRHGDIREIDFRITPQSLPQSVIAAVEIRMRERKGLRIHRQQTRLLRPDGKTPALSETTTDDIIACFFRHYDDALRNSPEPVNPKP